MFSGSTETLDNTGKGDLAPAAALVDMLAQAMHADAPQCASIRG